MFIIPFEKVKEVVDSRVQTRKKSMVYTHDQLIDQVCEKFNQTRKDILGKTRKSEFIIPRHLCMFLLHEVFHLKKTQIGRIFDCQHTTVIHAITNISKLRQLDEKIESTIQNIHLQLGTNDL
jgi:chromosomal replication initiator protein